MAAIIAQMTRANRERKKKKRIEISKCMYELPAFTDHFESQLHNKYLRCKKQMEEKDRADAFHKLVIERLEDILEERNETQTKEFQMGAFLGECCIISASLMLVPVVAVIVMLFWPETPEKIAPFVEVTQ